jgi:hypothetical protein
MNTFPQFSSHVEAACFSCAQPIPSAPMTSGYASGCGAFGKKCACGYQTWYDLNFAPQPKR